MSGEESEGRMAFESSPWMTLGGIVVIVVVVAANAILGLGLGFDQDEKDEQPTVTCSAYITEDGNASAICFVSGDVDFSWTGGNATNGTVRLDSLPAENSTVRKAPA